MLLGVAYDIAKINEILDNLKFGIWKILGKKCRDVCTIMCKVLLGKVPLYTWDVKALNLTSARH